MAGLGAPEMLIVLVIVMLLFGSAQLSKLAPSLGTAKRELEQGQAQPPTTDPAGPSRWRASTTCCPRAMTVVREPPR